MSKFATKAAANMFCQARYLEDLSARMSEPEHRWLLLEIDGRWKTLLPRTAERG